MSGLDPQEFDLTDLRPAWYIREVWVSIKFLSAKFGFTPPPEKGPKWGINCTNQYKILKIDAFSGGGAGKPFYGQNDFMDIWAFLIVVNIDPEKPPHVVWGFFTFQCFVFFLIFAFSCLCFSYFPLLLSAPQSQRYGCECEYEFWSRARKPWSANCELKHWNFGAGNCLIHGLHSTV